MHAGVCSRQVHRRCSNLLLPAIPILPKAWAKNFAQIIPSADASGSNFKIHLGPNHSSPPVLPPLGPSRRHLLPKQSHCSCFAVCSHGNQRVLLKVSQVLSLPCLEPPDAPASSRVEARNLTVT